MGWLVEGWRRGKLGAPSVGFAGKVCHQKWRTNLHEEPFGISPKFQADIGVVTYHRNLRFRGKCIFFGQGVVQALKVDWWRCRFSFPKDCSFLASISRILADFSSGLFLQRWRVNNASVERFEVSGSIPRGIQSHGH